MRKLGLIGFAGSGKSSLLKAAEKDGYSTIDTDELMKDSNVNIQDLLFKGKDEEFRGHEKTAIKKAIGSDAEVIAFGGGVHSKHIAWSCIVESDITIIFLEQDFKKCIERAPDRPLMKKLGMKGYEKLFGDRMKMYREASQNVVYVLDMSPDDVWAEVKLIWN